MGDILGSFEAPLDPLSARGYTSTQAVPQICPRKPRIDDSSANQTSHCAGGLSSDKSLTGTSGPVLPYRTNLPLTQNHSRCMLCAGVPCRFHVISSCQWQPGDNDWTSSGDCEAGCRYRNCCLIEPPQPSGGPGYWAISLGEVPRAVPQASLRSPSKSWQDWLACATI